MAQRPQRRPIKSDLGSLAHEAASRGDLQTSRRFLEEARRQDKTNADHAANHAAVCERMGDVDAALAALTDTLRLRPALEVAARRLSALLTRYDPRTPENLDPFGLRIALGFDTLDHAPVAGAALARLKKTTRLGALLEEGHASGFAAVARGLVQRRTDDVLKDDLLLTALEKGIVKDPRLELLFSALRRTLLLDVPVDRFEDKALTRFAVALMAQTINNSHVWHADTTEEAALAALTIDGVGLAAGEFEPSRRLLLAALYRPLDVIASELSAQALAALRPKAFRELVATHLTERRDENRIAAGIETLAAIEDVTSKRVAGQYEQAPYPRWTSLMLPAPGAIRQALVPFVGADKLGFFEQPFDVLIAGCGTGRQALQTAVGFGPNARVLALDLSLASLAYAKRMAARHGISNITFARADILGLPRLGRRFRVIEAIGVLHHMGDPAAGLEALVECLEPGGLIYLGLYSKLSRGKIAELRKDPGYPGPDCSDAQARAYRGSLMQREELKPELPGMGFLGSRDFYSLNEFRDLVLHQSERQHTLPEIEGMLGESGLTFRGFTHESIVRKAFAQRFPDNPWPGRLADWHVFEEANPRIFDAMYRFWCEKTA